MFLLVLSNTRMRQDRQVFCIVDTAKNAQFLLNCLGVEITRFCVKTGYNSKNGFGAAANKSVLKP